MARTWPNNAANRLKVGANPSVLNFPGTSATFTLSAWVKLNSNGAADQTFISKYDGTFGPLMRSLSGKVRMFWIDAGAGGHEAIGATTMSTGVWNHIAAVWTASGTGMLVYLNGAQDGQDTTSTMNTTADTANGWTFGARGGGSNPLDGDMCEMAMFTGILTADQIAALAKGASPLLVAPSKIAGWWPTFASTDNQVDFSKNSNNLVLVGTLASANHAPVQPQIPGMQDETAWQVSAATTPPVNTAAPVASPEWPEVARVVSTTNGSWTGSPGPTFTYQWQHSADGSTGWANIGGATSASYTVSATYNTEFLRCVVTGTNTDPGSPVSANSNVIGPVTDSPDAGQMAFVFAS